MSDNPNPNHNKLLELIPGELHPLIIPVLKEWDQGVNNRFAEIRSEYDAYKPYKAFVDNNVDPSFAQQAVQLVNRLQENPQEILEQINENWSLGYVSKDNLPDSNEEDDFMLDNEDIFKDPRIKALTDGYEAIQAQLREQQESSESEKALAQFESELDTLEEKTKGEKLPFDRTFVTALMAQGYDGDDAVKQFHQVLAGHGLAATTTTAPPSTDNQPPAILGGSPVGSGLPDSSVKFGALSKNDVNGTVEQLLAQRAQSDQG